MTLIITWEKSFQFSKCPVCWPEVMSPLWDTMGLIYRNTTDPFFVQSTVDDRAILGDVLRGIIKYIQLLISKFIQNIIAPEDNQIRKSCASILSWRCILLDVLPALSRTKKFSCNSIMLEGQYLILHQRYKGRNDYYNLVFINSLFDNLNKILFYIVWCLYTWYW